MTPIEFIIVDCFRRLLAWLGIEWNAVWVLIRCGVCPIGSRRRRSCRHNLGRDTLWTRWSRVNALAGGCMLWNVGEWFYLFPRPRRLPAEYEKHETGFQFDFALHDRSSEIILKTDFVTMNDLYLPTATLSPSEWVVPLVWWMDGWLYDVICLAFFFSPSPCVV